MQALDSFTKTFAGRQPTTQELAKVEELSNVVRNSAAFKALGQEQQDFDNRNKQSFDAFNRLREQNPNQFQTATGQQTQNTQNAQIQAFNQQQANAAQQFNQQATPPTVSPESASQMAQTGPTTQELTEGRAREQQQAAAGAVTGGGNVTFEETEGRTGVPKPGKLLALHLLQHLLHLSKALLVLAVQALPAEAKTTQVGTAAQATEPTTDYSKDSRGYNGCGRHSDGNGWCYPCCWHCVRTSSGKGSTGLCFS
jgi:hypothetical protein